MLQVHVKSWGLKIETNTLFLTNMWENTSKWCFWGSCFHSKPHEISKTSWVLVLETSSVFEQLMSFVSSTSWLSHKNLMSFWTAHEILCSKAHEFYMKSSWVSESSWLKAHEFSTTSWVLSTSWGLIHVEIMSFICWRSWAFHFGICWNSWAFLGGLWQPAGSSKGNF